MKIYITEEQRSFNFPYGTHYQTTYYAELSKLYHQLPIWLIAENEKTSEVYASWLILLSPTNFREPPKHIITKYIDKNIFSYHGPVLSQNISLKEKQYIITSFITLLDELLKKYRIITFQLDCGYYLSDQEMLLIHDAFVSKGFQVQQIYTYILEIKSDVEIQSLLKPEKRTKIRKAESMGLQFFELTNQEGLNLFIELYEKTQKRNGFKGSNYNMLVNTYKVLGKNGIEKLFFVKDDRGILAAQCSFIYGDLMIHAGVSIDERCYVEKLPANDYLQYKIMEWAKKNNIKNIDFAGAQPNTSNLKIQAIDKFKESFGGDLKQTYRITKASSKMLNLIKRIAYKLFE